MNEVDGDTKADVKLLIKTLARGNLVLNHSFSRTRAIVCRTNDTLVLSILSRNCD